jgi:hypothetical protein
VIDLGRPFEAAFHPARAYLLQKALYGLLGFDVALTMISHAGRYGMAGFNVAHFAWLDRLFPVPTAAAYVALLTLTGLCSLVLVLFRMARPLKLLVFVLYTFAWLWSLLDSYQHHYLLSWLLLWAAFAPDVSGEQASAAEAPLVRGVGMPMTAITCAIVYGFTGLAKSEPDFRAGYVLERLSRSRPVGSSQPGVLDPIRDLLMDAFGLELRTAWTWLACSLIALQWAIAVGYLASIPRDEGKSRLAHGLSWLAGLGALSFHAFAEITEMFDIGWFSYYMLAVAFALLAPASWVAQLVAIVSLPARRFVKRFAGSEKAASPVGRGMALVLPVLGVVSAGAIGLPGTLVSYGVFALGIAAAGAWLWRTGRALQAVWLPVCGLIAAFALELALTQSEVRFDYYRRTGGELLTLGELEAALAAYQKAERYAPPGKSRAKNIARIEAMLRAGAHGK